jgi:hypothetical protein
VGPIVGRFKELKRTEVRESSDSAWHSSSAGRRRRYILSSQRADDVQGLREAGEGPGPWTRLSPRNAAYVCLISPRVGSAKPERGGAVGMSAENQCVRLTAVCLYKYRRRAQGSSGRW